MNNLIFFGLCALLVYMPIARGAVRMWSFGPALIAIYALVFIWIWQSKEFKKTILDKPLWLFAALAGLSIVFSIQKHDSVYAALSLLGYIGVYYIVANGLDRVMRTRLASLIFIMGAGLSLYGLLQYSNALGHSWWMPADFPAATFVNHNHFAGLLELIIPVSIMFLLSYKPGKFDLRFVLILGLTLMLAAFLLAQSRGGWICLLISLIVMNYALVRNNKIKKNSLFLLMILSVAAVSLIFINQEHISKRVDSISEAKEVMSEASLGSRLKIWEATLDIIKERPLLGSGIGTFDWAFNRFRPEGMVSRAVFAHNDYLQAISEVGVFAIPLLVWAVFLIAGKILKSNEISPLRLGYAIGALSLSLHGLVDFNFHIPSNALLFTVYLGIIVQDRGKRS